MRLKTLLVVATLTFCLCVAAPTFAQNLVTNGSFETGDFSGWTETGNFEFTSVISGAFDSYTGAQDGQFYVVAGPVGADGGISQTLTTVAGATYDISFWLAAVGDDPSDFSAYWNGNQLLSLSDPNTGAQWTQYTFTALGTGSDTLSFNFRDDPAYIAFDNVSVTQESGPSVPEPSSFLLLGTGVLGLGGFIRRKLGR